MVHPGEEPVDSHSHDTTSCDTIADKRLQYNEAHLEAVKAECAGYQPCVTSIVSENTALTLIEGGDLEMRTVCSPLVPRDANGQPLTGRWRNRYRVARNSTSGNRGRWDEEENASCPRDARITIRRDIDSHLTEAMESRDHHPEWQAVWGCLEATEEEEEETSDSAFLRVCRLAFTNRTVCNRTVHKTLENFFTRQLEHLQCVCKALPGSTGPKPETVVGLTPGLAGLAGLAGLVVCLALCCIFFLVWRRRQRARGTGHGTQPDQGEHVVLAELATARPDVTYESLWSEGDYQRLAVPEGVEAPPDDVIAAGQEDYDDCDVVDVTGEDANDVSGVERQGQGMVEAPFDVIEPLYVNENED